MINGYSEIKLKGRKDDKIVINQLYREIKWDFKNGFLDKEKSYEYFSHIFENASGITIDKEKGNGYQNIIIELKVDEKLGFVKAFINTQFGKI